MIQYNHNLLCNTGWLVTTVQLSTTIVKKAAITTTTPVTVARGAEARSWGLTDLGPPLGWVQWRGRRVRHNTCCFPCTYFCRYIDTLHRVQLHTRRLKKRVCVTSCLHTSYGTVTNLCTTFGKSGAARRGDLSGGDLSTKCSRQPNSVSARVTLPASGLNT